MLNSPKMRNRSLDRPVIFWTCVFFSLFAVAVRSPRTAKALEHNGSTAVAAQHTWYIRQDGGDRKQCTGMVDSPYSGHGNSQPCAFKHPYYLFTNDTYNNKGWIISGGDTVIFRGGPYRMGYKGPNPHDMWGSCPGDPFGCSMPPIPSGTASQPTRFLGEHYSSCQQKTQLFGGYGLGVILPLQGSKNVDVECLDLTDHGQCSRVGSSQPASEVCSSTYPLSDYAGNAIETSETTANVLLKNLNIHGFTSRGIIGAIGGLLTVDHVRIAFNGGAGWDFDNGSGTASASDAALHASYLTVEWNGCNEEYPLAHSVPAFSCLDQDNGGYGDGVGTPDTPLNFSCDHCTFRYNTQDGLDLLHVNAGKISVTNSTAYGNMGQQWKFGPVGRLVFQNNTTIHNCRRLSAPFSVAPQNYNRYLSLFCRAAGDGVAMSVTDQGTYTLQNNSYAGYGATSYDIVCSGHCASASIVFENNLNVGYEDPKNQELPAVFYAEKALWLTLFRGTSHNIFYNMRTCPKGWTESCVNPGIVNLPKWTGEASLDAIDFHLMKGSPARKSGASIPEISTDHDGQQRPANSAYDVGAFQFHP